jgi:hypothetical protein
MARNSATVIPMAPRRKRKQHNLPAIVQASIREPALVRGEDPKEYRRIFSAVRAALMPADIIERFWVDDIVDCVWEVDRLRRIQTELLEDNVGHTEYSQLSDDELNAEIARLMEETGLVSPENLIGLPKVTNHERIAKERVLHDGNGGGRQRPRLAAAYKKHGPELDRISRMIATRESRRDTVLRELERYRESRARRSPAAEDIVDAEFTEAAADGSR